MPHRLGGLTALLFYVILTWLLPWLWSDNLDLAGGFVVLMASVLALSVGTIGLLVFVLTRAGSMAHAGRVGRDRLTENRDEPNKGEIAVLPLGCLAVGVVLLASLFYVDYYLVQRTFVFLLGILLLGSGSALLVAPRLRRASRPPMPVVRPDATFSVVLVMLGILLLVSGFYVHYYPAQRAMMLGEGIALSSLGVLLVVRRAGSPTV